MPLEYKKRQDMDMTQWDIDDDTGTLAHVAFPRKIGQLPEMNKKIELEISPWVEENINGLCFYTTEETPTKDEMEYNQELVFYFEKVEDAFLFKLTWA